MRTLTAVAIFALLPASVLAQPEAVQQLDLSRAATLPPTSAALADEVNSALVLNPAGLNQVNAGQLFYLHERAIGRGETIDGLYLGDTIGGALGVGFGVEWVRASAGPSLLNPDRRKITWGLSLGGERFSLGANFGFFQSKESTFIDEANTVDLGMLARPARWLSVGAVVRNLNQPAEQVAGLPFRAPLVLPRTYELAVGLRPIGDRFTAGASYGFRDRDGLGEGWLSYVVNAEVLRGFVLGAGVSHGLTSSRELAIQLSATFNLPSFGVTYGAGSSGGGLDHVVQARLSSADYRGFTLGGGKVATLDLAEALTRSGGSLTAVLGGSQTDAFLELTRLLAQAETDPDLAALVVKLESLPEVGLGRAEELRQALLRLKTAGKRVISVIFTAGDTEYLVASASDRILAVPGSMLMVNGIASSVTYLGGSMDKLDVSWDVARVGAYKNAPDQFTRSDMSDEQRQTIEAYLDVDMKHLETTLAQARSLDVEKVRAIIREGILSPVRAMELGLIDGVIDPVQLDDELKKLVPQARYAGKYALHDPAKRSWATRRRVAIIPVVGTIASGKSREDPLGFAEIAGAETVIRALSVAQEDDDVAAIVLRIDSGGGDGLASDLMYRAVLEAKKRKPVIASMGDVAASGGYYAAMGAHKIYAVPTTLTGSIGVFMMKPALGGLAQRLGIHQETIKRGELSTLLSSFEPWSAEEKAAAQKWVDAFYDAFITEVAKSRNLPKDRVDEVARGRVWAGLAAREIGLVDELGSLQDAIDAARRQAGVPDSEPYDLEIVGEPRGFMGSLGNGFVKLDASPGLPEETKVLLRSLGLPPAVILQPGVKAMMPFHLRAH